ncbi:MAG: SPOR domain-containing protein [Eubacteriales bacterium]|nr:SPOR domain-containing protein [Eubacteriales bacterium]MDD3199921.1 SPOR domain-containing protein [Eubacteriales bacterium]MDD4122509.1 SPOR domain-containing protein [Eubacteriales bacterium]MDD4630430.1 SPOR domain-containing protein [Eubacteriales bacterium]
MRKRNRYPGRRAGISFSVFIIVIILAVAVGYAGTKYVIYPYLIGSSTPEGTNNQIEKESGTTTETGIDIIPDAPSIIIDKQNLKNDTADPKENSKTSDTSLQSEGSAKGPFSVQFGNFGLKSGAEAMSSELEGAGIYSYIYESDGSYRVLGLPYASKEKANEAAAVVSAVVSDIFVVNLSTVIH